jgi:hypothetical protein
VWRTAPEDHHDHEKTKLNWIFLGGIALLVLPLILQYFGNAWVRMPTWRCCTCCWPWA